MGGGKSISTERTMQLVLVCYILALINSRTYAGLAVPEEIVGYEHRNWTIQEKVRIEMVKYQILTRLGIRDPPLIQRSESATEVVRLLLEEREAEEQKRFGKNAAERLIVHAKNGSSSCLNTSDAPCSRYVYELNTNLNMSQAVLWVYRNESDVSETITISLSFLSDKDEMTLKEFSTSLQKTGWNKVHLTLIYLPKLWEGTFYMPIELSGKPVEAMENHDPYLMVQKLFVMQSRHRREATCNPSENCCLKPLKVSFAQIGFNWVLYPTEFEANMCTGKCRRDHSEMRNHYERALSQVIDSDSDVRESLGDCWTNCCKSKELEAVRVIYNDTNGIIHDQYIPALRVKSCACF